MAASNDDLLNAMENSFFAFPEIPGKTERFGFEGVRGVWCPISPSFHANATGNIRLNADNVDATIQQVHEFFTSRERNYQWFIVPALATPGNLGERLEAAGIKKGGEAAGLYTTDFDMEVKTNPAIIVREVTPDNEADLNRVMAKGFGLDEIIISEVMGPMIQAVNGRRYVAYLNGEAVSAAVMFYMPDAPIAVFQGAATLEEHRGQGAYSALIQRRLQDAKADGMEAAVLQADRSTSAPICAKYGFEELCGIEFYVWMAKGESGH